MDYSKFTQGFIHQAAKDFKVKAKVDDHTGYAMVVVRIKGEAFNKWLFMESVTANRPPGMLLIFKNDEWYNKLADGVTACLRRFGNK